MMTPERNTPTAHRPGYKIATYNVHRCTGADARCDPDRIVAVLDEIGADIFGLQEIADVIEWGPDGDQFNHLTHATGYHAVAGPNIVDKKGPYGNALLSRHPIADVRRIDLTVAPRDPRGAIVAMVELPDSPLRVVVSHLGLKRAERHRQIAILADASAHFGDEPTIYLADFNVWGPQTVHLRRLGLRPGRHRSPATFPSGCPMLALDRILAHPADVVFGVHVHRTPLSRWASDHLPVVGWVDPSGIGS